jgi:hypothetical protein
MTTKKKGRKRTARASSQPRRKLRKLEFAEWLNEVTASHEAADSRGACLISNPQTGGNDCIRTDEATCNKIGGTFIGGPCGPR